LYVLGVQAIAAVSEYNSHVFPRCIPLPAGGKGEKPIRYGES
jgi:hypothetical protein